MIHGKYLTSLDDTTAVMALREQVFVEEQGFSSEGEIDDLDDMAVYALVFDDDGHPAGCGRLVIDHDDRFCIGRVCVLSSARGHGLGDLVMRMLIYRAQELNASSVFLSSQLHAVGFYAKYGFRPVGEQILDENVPHQPMMATADELDISGSCAHMPS